MATNGSIEYDIDVVIDYVTRTAPETVYDLVSNLNKLASELESCESKFHCKGGDSANALMKIYNGFSTIIGSSVTNVSGKGLAGCAAQSAHIFNVIYQEAKTDQQIQNSSNYQL